MYYDAEEEKEIGGIKGINQVICREVEEGSMVQGPSSSQPRDVQYRSLLDVLHFKLGFFGSLRSQIAVDNI
jgi:hypothetical protein